MSEVKISIIVPVYNAEKHLCACVDSILNQTFTDFELILVNDGSKDNSGKICDEYKGKNAKVVVIHKENGGSNSARRAGIEIAKGKYVGFVDSDDWIERDMYEYMYRNITKYKCDLVTTGFIRESGGIQTLEMDNIEFGFYNKDSLNKVIYPKLISTPQYFNIGVMPSMGTKLFETNSLKSIICGIDDNITIGEDAANVFSYIFKSDSIYLSDRCFYNYRKNEGSVMHKYDKEMWKKNDVLVKALRKNSENCEFDFSEQIDSYHVFLSDLALYSEIFYNEASLYSRINSIKKGVTPEVSKTIKRVLNRKKEFYIPTKKRIILFFLQHRLIIPIFICYKFKSLKNDG